MVPLVIWLPYVIQNYYEKYNHLELKDAIWQMVPFVAKKILIFQMVHKSFV